LPALIYHSTIALQRPLAKRKRSGRFGGDLSIAFSRVPIASVRAEMSELMDLVVVMKLIATLLKVLDPVETGILDLQRKALLHLTALHFIYKHAESIHAIDILLKRGRHELYTGIGQRPMPLLLIHP